VFRCVFSIAFPLTLKRDLYASCNQYQTLNVSYILFTLSIIKTCSYENIVETKIPVMHQLSDIVSILITVTDKCTFEKKIFKERVGNN